VKAEARERDAQEFVAAQRKRAMEQELEDDKQRQERERKLLEFRERVSHGGGPVDVDGLGREYGIDVDGMTLRLGWQDREVAHVEAAKPAGAAA
jgi:hypothetical protein